MKILSIALRLQICNTLNSLEKLNALHGLDNIHKKASQISLRGFPVVAKGPPRTIHHTLQKCKNPHSSIENAFFRLYKILLLSNIVVKFTNMW